MSPEMFKMQLVMMQAGQVVRAIASIDPDILKEAIALRERVQSTIRPDATTSAAAIRGGMAVTAQMKVLLFCREQILAHTAAPADVDAAVKKGMEMADRVFSEPPPNELSRDSVAEFLEGDR